VSDSCPHCGGTDVIDVWDPEVTLSSGWVRSCLDCNGFWSPRLRHQLTRRARREAERIADVTRKVNQQGAPYFGHGVCHYCGGTADTQDHVVPIARGGPGGARNIVPSCGPCNQDKGANDPTCSCWFCVRAVQLYGGRGPDKMLPEVRRAYRNREQHHKRYLR
jgi:HNH endonuclease